jgi:hypothetical protein
MKGIYMNNIETGEDISILEYFRKKLWSASSIPTTFFKKYNRKSKISKILYGSRHKSI